MLEAFDAAVNAALTPWRQGMLLVAVAWFTDIGAGHTAVAVAAVASALLWSGGRGRFVAPLWLVFLGAEATTWSIKFAVGRLRPPSLPGIEALSPSFPSAHATVALALYGFMALTVAAGAPRHRSAILGCGVLLVFLIGFSRIVLSLHYLTDVLAGYAIAAAWLWFGWRRVARPP